METRLAAIIIAEAADYSRQTGENEAGAQTTPKVRFRDVIDPRIALHHGRVVSGLGDVVLAEFANVVTAVKCGVEVQREMAERNVAVPEDERLEFRIGINLCDIAVDGDEIFGDGVSIAGLLGSKVGPGGICISATAFDQVEGKLNVGFEFLGEQKLKNISEPLRAYRVLI